MLWSVQTRPRPLSHCWSCCSDFHNNVEFSPSVINTAPLSRFLHASKTVWVGQAVEWNGQQLTSSSRSFGRMVGSVTVAATSKMHSKFQNNCIKFQFRHLCFCQFRMVQSSWWILRPRAKFRARPPLLATWVVSWSLRMMPWMRIEPRVWTSGSTAPRSCCTATTRSRTAFSRVRTRSWARTRGWRASARVWPMWCCGAQSARRRLPTVPFPTRSSSGTWRAANKVTWRPCFNPHSHENL